MTCDVQTSMEVQFRSSVFSFLGSLSEGMIIKRFKTEGRDYKYDKT